MVRATVVFIAGASRSGSTLLARMLGSVDSFFDAGELIDFWERGALQEGECGCGTALPRCPIWSEITGSLEGVNDPRHAELMVSLRDRWAHSRAVPFRLLTRRLGRTLPAELNPYLEGLRDLYRAVAMGTGCRVIVDASKNLGYALLLAGLDVIELKVVHLIRDPRATAYSWQRTVTGLRREAPAKSVAQWATRNAVAELVRLTGDLHVTRLRYEDLVASPQVVLQSLLAALGIGEAALPGFSNPGEIVLGPNHTVYGNPNRFQSGVVKVKEDTAWRHGLGRGDGALVTAMTWPFLIGYGYGLDRGDRSSHRRRV
jgi:hypothetical protein